LRNLWFFLRTILAHVCRPTLTTFLLHFEAGQDTQYLHNGCQYMKEILSIPSAQLKRIIALKERIEKLQSQLQAIVTDSAPAGQAAPKKRTMSLAARRKIAAAARARWARVKGTAKAAPKKRTMSLAARRKIAAAARARWARVRAAKKAQ
jgi:hypothetical protein